MVPLSGINFWTDVKVKFGTVGLTHCFYQGCSTLSVEVGGETRLNAEWTCPPSLP